MSEQFEHDLGVLIDDAARQAPAMNVASAAVLAGGRRRARRRQALAGGGLAVGAAALAGSMWLASTTGLLGAAPPPPASEVVTEAPTATTDGDATDGDDTNLAPGLDVDLFSDFAVGRYTGRLTQADESAPMMLQLTDASTGERLDDLEATAPFPGLWYFVNEHITVAVWDPGDSVASRPLIRTDDGGDPRWSDVGSEPVGETTLLFSAWQPYHPRKPGEVVDVYLAGEDGAFTTISGRSVDWETMVINDQTRTAYVDRDHQLWGQGALDSPTFLTTPLSTVSRNWGDRSLSEWTYLLPPGATDVVVEYDGRGTLESEWVSVGDRPVLVTRLSGSESEPEGEIAPDIRVEFVWEGEVVDLEDYLANPTGYGR